MHIASEMIEILNSISGENFLLREGKRAVVNVYDSANIPIINPIRNWLISFFDLILGNNGGKTE